MSISECSPIDQCIIMIGQSLTVRWVVLVRRQIAVATKHSSVSELVAVRVR